MRDYKSMAESMTRIAQTLREVETNHLVDFENTKDPDSKRYAEEVAKDADIALELADLYKRLSQGGNKHRTNAGDYAEGFQSGRLQVLAHLKLVVSMSGGVLNMVGIEAPKSYKGVIPALILDHDEDDPRSDEAVKLDAHEIHQLVTRFRELHPKTEG